jgi:hypothetical protein
MVKWSAARFTATPNHLEVARHQNRLLMNKVFPRKWYDQLDRSHWGTGPWRDEPEDRAQWSDGLTGYPCLAIRSTLGCWAGYVGVCPHHPAFGQELEIGHVNWHCYTDETHYIEPPPEDADAVVDVNDPKGSILSCVRMPDYLWFFGFDFAHAGDAIPSAAAMDVHIRTTPRGTKETYKDLDYVKKTCTKIALELSKMTGTKTMDSTRQRLFAS